MFDDDNTVLMLTLQSNDGVVWWYGWCRFIMGCMRVQKLPGHCFLGHALAGLPICCFGLFYYDLFLVL